jgi:hypothetical protein
MHRAPPSPDVDIRRPDEHTSPKRVDPCDIDAPDPADPSNTTKLVYGSPGDG